MKLHQLPFLLKTAFQETLSHIKDFKILIVCLFLGVFVIGFVQNTTGALENGLRRDGKSILGGDVSIRNIYTPLPADALAFITAQGKVSESIEMRGLVQHAKENQTGLSEIKAIDDQYPLFGSFVLKNAGAIDNLYTYLATPQNQLPSIVMDTALTERLVLKIGDTVQIGTQSFILKDIIETEPDRAGGATFSVGPRSIIREDIVGQTGLIVDGSQIHYHYKVALSNPETIENFEQSFKDKFPDGGSRLLKYTNASPRIQGFLDQLSLFFTLVGLSALLIGGVGIGNAVKVVLEKRLQSIAIMKSTGASVSFVFTLWLSIIILTGFVGIIPAIALSHIAPFVVVSWVGDMLPVPLVPTLSILGMLQTVFLALSILVLFSILTLSRASRTKPALLLRQGLGASLEERPDKLSIIAFLLVLVLSTVLIISTSYHPKFTAYFLIGAGLIYGLLKATSLALVFLLKRIKGVKNTSLKMAIVNLTRPNHQTFTILLSLGLALTLFTTIALIEYNVKNRIANDLPDRAPAFFFIDIQKSQMAEFEKLLTPIEGVDDLTKVPNLRGRIRYVNGIDAEKALADPSEKWLLRGDRGFTYLRDKPDYSEILEGTWWNSDYQGEPLISVVEDVAKGFNVGVGDSLTLNILGRDITAKIANVRTVDWSTMTINYAITFAPGVLDNAPHSYLATISAPLEQENYILNQVAKNFPNVTAIQVRDALRMATDILEKIAIAMRAIAFLALVTGVFVLSASILSSLRQRRYETILIKVLGGKPKLIVSVINTEFVLLGMIAGVLSLLFGSVAAYLVVVKIMNFPWHWDIATALIVLGLSLAITLLFSFWAISKSLKSKPVDFLRNE